VLLRGKCAQLLGNSAGELTSAMARFVDTRLAAERRSVGSCVAHTSEVVLTAKSHRGVTVCPSRNRGNLFETWTGANGGYGPRLLPGLGRFMQAASITIVVCEDCGFMQFFAGDAERKRLAETPRHWKRVSGLPRKH